MQHLNCYEQERRTHMASIIGLFVAGFAAQFCSLDFFSVFTLVSIGIDAFNFLSTIF